MADKMTLTQIREKADQLQNSANEVARFRTANLGRLSENEINQMLTDEKNIRRQVRQFENDALDVIWDDLQAALKEIREATDKMRVVRAHLTTVRRVASFAGAVLGLGVSMLSGNVASVAVASLNIVELVNGFRDEDDEQVQAEEDAVG